MNRKDFLATTFSAGLGLALMPTFLSCKTTKPINRSVFEPLNLSTGNFAKVRGKVSRYTNKGGTVGIFETKEGFVTVSYTHLDVYKRQPATCSLLAFPFPVMAIFTFFGEYSVIGIFL